MTGTEKLYEASPFARGMETVLLALDGSGGRPRAALAATVFYPEGGGQPADGGMLHFAGGDAAVVDVQEQDGVIWHTLDTLPGGAVPGSAVRGELDWARRFDHMQQHTGEHILSGTLHRLFGAENVGFHIGAEAVRMDTGIPLTDAQLRQAEQAANRTVWDDPPLRIWYPAPGELACLTYRSKKKLTGPVRIVEIPGADVCACCGTHVERAGQVGTVKILTAEHYKGGMRLAVVCGGRALDAFEGMRARQAAIGARLSARADQTADAVRRLSDEYAALKFAHYGLCGQLFDALAAQAAAHPDQPALFVVPGLDPDGLHRLATRLTAAVPGVCAALTAAEKGAGYCVASARDDVRPLVRALNAAFQGRGGGKPGCCQGSCAGAAPEQLAAFLRAQLAQTADGPHPGV